MPPRANAIAYDDDFVAWLEDQARRLRRGELDALDIENLAEELEGMARSDRREIRNRLIVLLVYLLKYQLQPRRRSSGWLGTIGEQRGRIGAVIDDSPSLRAYPASAMPRPDRERPSKPGRPRGCFPNTARLASKRCLTLARCRRVR